MQEDSSSSGYSWIVYYQGNVRTSPITSYDYSAARAIVVVSK